MAHPNQGGVGLCAQQTCYDLRDEVCQGNGGECVWFDPAARRLERQYLTLEQCQQDQRELYRQRH